MASGRRIAADLRGYLLSASPAYIDRLKSADDPDPWLIGFAVVLLEEDYVIGLGGFVAPPDAEGSAEIAYGIAPDYQGRGFATETAEPLIEFARNDPRVRKICAHTLPGPNASARILEKCGLSRAGQSLDQGRTVWRWERELVRPQSPTKSVPLDPSIDEIVRWGECAVRGIAENAGALRSKRVYPKTTSAAIREQLDHALPVEGADFDDLLRVFREVIVPNCRLNSHPRMFGYVQSPGTAIGAMADLLASALNANLTAWRSAPAAIELERLTIDWIKEIVGFPQSATGLFVSGGSIANLSALATARHDFLGRESLGKVGRASEQPRLRIYASAETHHSIAKAAALLGLAADSVVPIRANTNGRIDLDKLVSQIMADKTEGLHPLCLVGNAGTVMAGAIDPLLKLSEVAQRFGLWFHVDACYGGFAMLAPSARPSLAGIEKADSVALDPHKWLYLPVDCGCVLYRDPRAARDTFAHDADYTRILEKNPDEAFASWNYGPELSRRFRALKVWMLLKGVGLRELGQAIEANISAARHFENLVKKSEDFEMLAPVALSIFCFRWIPKQFQHGPRDESRLDALNEQLLVALQHDGSSYLSNAVIQGRFALRGCVMNYRTTFEDMDILMADLRRVAQTVRVDS